MQELYKKYSKRNKKDIIGIKDPNFNFTIDDISMLLHKILLPLLVIVIVTVTVIFVVVSLIDFTSLFDIIFCTIFIIIAPLKALSSFRKIFALVNSIYFDGNKNLCIKYLFKTKIINVDNLRKIYIYKKPLFGSRPLYYIIITYLTENQKEKKLLIYIGRQSYIGTIYTQYIKNFFNNFYLD